MAIFCSHCGTALRWARASVPVAERRFPLRPTFPALRWCAPLQDARSPRLHRPGAGLRLDLAVVRILAVIASSSPAERCGGLPGLLDRHSRGARPLI